MMNCSSDESAQLKLRVLQLTSLTSTKGDLKAEVFTALDMAMRVRTATKALVFLSNSGRSINTSCKLRIMQRFQFEVDCAGLFRIVHAVA
jgi:hypothetical protein